LSIERWGRPTDLRPPDVASLFAEADRIELSRGHLTEWYLNAPEGLEQGFVIADAPEEEGAGLAIDLAFHGNRRSIGHFVQQVSSKSFYMQACGSVLIRSTPPAPGPSVPMPQVASTPWIR
jgi:hypothetical protein